MGGGDLKGRCAVSVLPAHLQGVAGAVGGRRNTATRANFTI
jgi:hypothetical protein